eukprot:9391428-Pyramimonas_sp.AAC.1
MAASSSARAPALLTAGGGLMKTTTGWRGATRGSSPGCRILPTGATGHLGRVGEARAAGDAPPRVARRQAPDGGGRDRSVSRRRSLRA